MRTYCRLAATAILVALGSCLSAVDFVRDPNKKKGADPLFQIRRGDKWGYMNRKGQTVIPPQFVDEGDFFGGLAWVRLANKWGYIDQTGHMEIPCQFDGAGDFSEGLAPVQVERKWGFINRQGRLVIAPQFQAVAAFSDGLSRFEIWDTARCGGEILTKDSAALREFRMHDFPPVANLGCAPQDGRNGFVDHSGVIAIAPTLQHAADFSEGLAVVWLGKPSGSRFGYIDKMGKLVIGPQFDEAQSFSEGLAAVEIGVRTDGTKQIAGESGFIDPQGKFVIPPRFAFDFVSSFSEGTAAVCLPGMHCGYIDKQGVFVIPPKYQEATPFSEGLAWVSPENEEDDYYIDRRGRRVLTPKLPGGRPFRDGLTIVGNPGDQKYVDREGRVVAPYEADSRP